MSVASAASPANIVAAGAASEGRASPASAAESGAQSARRSGASTASELSDRLHSLARRPPMGNLEVFEGEPHALSCH
jgi:hypothetical protein